MTHRRSFLPQAGSTFLLAVLSVVAMFVSFSGQKSMTQSVTTRWLILLLVAVSITAMALRVGRPLLALSVVVGIYLPAVALHAEPSVMVPCLVVLYSYLTQSSAKRAVTAAVGSFLLVAIPTAVEPPDSDDAGLLLTRRLGGVLCVVMAGLMTRVWRARQESLREVERERLRANEMAEQRDRAVERERLAFQLHDSVGHCLATIIALSEGLTDLSTDPDYARAVRGINSLAREGLGETRQVIESLGASGSSGAFGTPLRDTAPHGWDGIEELIDHVRATGITINFTEEGARTADKNGELCFSLTREALTNCLRHGKDITRVAVLWQHHPDGSTHVLVEDDGDVHGWEGTESCSGTGLRRYRDLVLSREGEFYAGSPDGNGWVVDATVVPWAAERMTTP